jgi:hypothetical protein
MKYSLGIVRKQKVKEKKMEQKSVIFTPCNALGPGPYPTLLGAHFFLISPVTKKCFSGSFMRGRRV